MNKINKLDNLIDHITQVLENSGPDCDQDFVALDGIYDTYNEAINIMNVALAAAEFLATKLKIEVTK